MSLLRSTRVDGATGGSAGGPPVSGSRDSRGRASPKDRRGRAGSSASTNPRPDTLLRAVHSGNLNQRARLPRRASGRSRSHGIPSPHDATAQRPSPAPTRPPGNPPFLSGRDYMNQMTVKYQELKTQREIERTNAIRDGFLADPDKKTGLDKAITPVGTCTEMCPEFERVERIVQNMVDRSEKSTDDDTGRDIPSHDRMIKRFRRSAAGYDEQLPSDIRTPETLQRTLDYLLDIVVGGDDRLAIVHKFVWDRTRSIRNDFSIQQVTREEDVRIAVNCFERIARFHILSLHQLSNADKLSGEHFDAHQEREQLQNTLLSLMYYYDDYRDKQRFDHEPEFRAYCVILEMHSQQPDLEDRMQSWPQELLGNHRIRTAFKLYSAAGNTLYDQGPLKPQTAFDVAQANTMRFWKLLKSKTVTYLMACVAEVYFGQVRFVALQGLWKSVKRAPATIQAKIQDWTLRELAKFLGFDSDNQVLKFCKEFRLDFKYNAVGEQYLDFVSHPDPTIDKSSTPNKQVFSAGIVEEKRYHRTLVAIINGVGVAQAIREGLVVQGHIVEDTEADQDSDSDEENSLFVPETKKEEARSNPSNPLIALNPQASAFQPVGSTSQPPASSPLALAGTSAPVTIGSDAKASASASSSGNRQPTLASIFENSAVGKKSPDPQETQSNVASSRLEDLAASLSAPKTFTPSFPWSSTSTSTTISSNFGKPSFPVAAAAAPSAKSTVPPLLNNGTSLTPPFHLANKNLDPSANGSQRPAKQSYATEAVGLADSTSGEQAGAQRFEPTPELPSLSKPPSSPRPGFRSLPSTANHLPTTPLISTQPLPNAQASQDVQIKPPMNSSGSTHLEQPSDSGSSRGDGPRFSFTNAQDSRSNPVEFFAKGSGFDVGIDSSVNVNQALMPQALATKQEAPLQSSSLPQTTATKPSIPASFSPNAAPTFPPSTNTKPKRKSPLGSQPPIVATDNAEKVSAVIPSDITLTKAARNLAIIGFLEPHGILQQYIEHIASPQVEDALRQFEREQILRDAQSVRHFLLSKKYFQRWKAAIWRKKLNRKAGDRRELLARSIRLESQRRVRGDSEAQAILVAQKEKERIQTEQLLRGQQQQYLEAHIPSRVPKRLPAGQKRKSLHGEDKDPSESDRVSGKLVKSHGHKRSKTMTDKTTSGRNLAAQGPVCASPLRLKSSVCLGRSILLNDHARSVSRDSIVKGKKDSTLTDYFRLKALGIDPNTPLFPETKSSLERKKNPKEETFNIKSRKGPQIAASGERSAAHRIAKPSARAAAAPVTFLAGTQHTRSQTPAYEVQNDDDFLREVHKVQAAMSEDADWFKAQAALIEKEAEQQKKLPRSVPQRNSTDSLSPNRSSTNSGLARVNGYDYAPINGEQDSHHPLSRTEKRIRSTGAHGLATMSVSEYLPVAMSKSTRSAMTHKNVPKHAQKNGRERKQGEGNGRNRSDELEEDEGEEEGGCSTWSDQMPSPERAMKSSLGYKTRRKGGRRRQAEKDNKYIYESDEDSEADIRTKDPTRRPRKGNKISRNQRLSLSRNGTKGRLAPDEQGRETRTNTAHSQESSHLDIFSPDSGLLGEQGSETPDGGGWEQDEGDVSEEETKFDSQETGLFGEDSGNESTRLTPCRNGILGSGSEAQSFHMRLRSATPEPRYTASQGDAGGGMQMSRVTSGTGVSADDALVLSD